MTKIENLINNKPLESELLYSTIKLVSRILDTDIDDIPEDWFVDLEGQKREDFSYGNFEELHGYIVYNDYINEHTLHQLGIENTSDLIDFCYEYNNAY